MNSSNYFIGADIGTSGTKAVLVNGKGKIVASATETYSVLKPQPLWVEQWPDVWFDVVVKSIRKIVDKSGVPKEQILGLTISGLYGGSGIPCDKDMQPLHPALIWMDKRAEEETEWVRKEIGEKQIFDISANYIDPYYGYTKILWLKNHCPDIWKQTAHLVTPYAYCVYRLTGKSYYDHCSAGNIGAIYDIHAHQWSNEMLKALGIPKEMLSEELVDSTQIVGRLHKKGAELLGLMEGMPVGAGGVDCVVAMLSAGGVHYGDHVAMIGTSMAWGMMHDGRNCSPQMVNMPYVVGAEKNTYSYAGATTSGGILEWFTDEFIKRDESDTKALFKIMDDKAAELPPGSEGVLMLPYFMGERAPLWNPYARGSIYGLTTYHTQSHVYRAILEAVAYSLKTCLNSADNVNIKLSEQLSLVGGVTKSLLWKQIFADVTGMAIRCVVGGGEAAYGDAFLAAMAVGATSDIDDITQWVQFEPDIEPNKEMLRKYNDCYQLYEKYYQTLLPVMQELAGYGK